MKSEIKWMGASEDGDKIAGFGEGVKVTYEDICKRILEGKVPH